MRNKKDTLVSWILTVVLLILLVAAAIGFCIAVEYGRYLFLAPDGMDFSTFYWIDTLRR